MNRPDDRMYTVELTKRQLLVIANALNEVMHGIGGWELGMRLGEDYEFLEETRQLIRGTAAGDSGGRASTGR